MIRRGRNFLLRRMGRHMPSALRFVGHHYPGENSRGEFLDFIQHDPSCRTWLNSLENPTKTRKGFEICTLSEDMTSDWIKLYGQHEASTERFILEHAKPGGTFLDIGANIGYFSLLAASRGKMEVISFEPQRALAALLAQSVTHNRFQDRIRVEQLALSDAPSMMKMSSHAGDTGRSRLIDADQGDTPSDLVSVVVLDDWLKQNPPRQPVAVCKIDTEGAEYHVLRGMTHVLERDGPALVVEIVEEHQTRFNSTGAFIRDLLKARGYRDVSSSYAATDYSNGYFVKDKA